MIDFYSFLPKEVIDNVLLLAFHGRKIHNVPLDKWNYWDANTWNQKTPKKGNAKRGDDTFKLFDGCSSYHFPGAYARYETMKKDPSVHFDGNLGNGEWCMYMAVEWAAWNNVAPGFYAGPFMLHELNILINPSPVVASSEELELAGAVKSKLTILPD